MPEAVVAEVTTPSPTPIVTPGDVPTFIKTAETFPPKLPEKESQKPAAEAPAAVEPTEPEKAEAKQPDEKPKPGKTSYERRLDRAYRREAQERARAEAAERRIAEIQAQAQPAKPAETAPRLEDFSDYNEFVKASNEHAATQAVKAYEKRQRDQFAQLQQNKLLQEWEEKVESGALKYDDFDDVVGELKPITPLHRAIMRAENAPDVAHYLATHKNETLRIAALDVESQIREITRLEAKLLATPPPQPKVSKAPAPIAPVSGTAQAEAVIRDGMPYTDFVKVREKQLGRK